MPRKNIKNNLSQDEVVVLAKLAGLHLSEEKVEKYRQQLEETVNYVKNLNQLNTEKVKPTSQTTSLTNVFFPDGERNTRGLDQKEALKNAPNKKGNYFIVKRIL